MKTKTEKILMVLKIVAWLAAIGYSIQCGSEVVSFVLSFKNPELAKRLYPVHLDLFAIQQYNSWCFAYLMTLVIVSSALKATTWYLVVDLLLKLKIKNPFSIRVAALLKRISFLLFGVWVLSIIGKAYLAWVAKSTGIALARLNIGEEYLFISGIVYVISQVFRRGIEMQEENQLTV